MKSSSLTLATMVAAITFTALAAAGGPATVTAAAKAAPAPVKQRVEKPSAQAIVAKSEFTQPRKMTEGRDPFFPNSSRPFASETVAKPTGESSLPDFEFALQGISGSSEQPLAIINNTTFTTGEENDVIIKGKRIKIRCAEINMTAGTVLFEYGGSRRQLKLSSH